MGVSHLARRRLDEMSSGEARRVLLAREGTTLILITHHIEEIVPEIERVILLRGGRIIASGPKRSVLTAESLSGFDAPVTIDDEAGYYYARPGGNSAGFGRS